MTDFTSQAGQDKWVCDFFEYKKNGYFLDIGAYNGVQYSNSYYLEKELGWSGLLVEANKLVAETIQQNRSSIVVNKAIYKENGIIAFHPAEMAGSVRPDGKNQVEAITFKKLFEDYNCPKIIDYTSLDIEGGEIDALLGFPFNEYIVILWTIEHNLWDRGSDLKNDIFEILSKNNYIKVKDNVSSTTDGRYPFEDWYVHNTYLK